MIAEIALIQSQIDWLMHLSVRRLLGTSADLTGRIMGSTSVRTISEIWLHTVREKHPSESAKEWAEYAYTKLAELSSMRNDYMHTLYGIHAKFVTGPMKLAVVVAQNRAHNLGLRQQKAMKIRNSQEVNISNMKEARDKLARLSWVFAHIDSLANGTAEHSPWRRKLSRSLLLQF